MNQPKALDWRALYREAVQRAQRLNDPRANVLEQGKGDPVRTLKRLSIISRADLDREFPIPK